MSRNVNIMFLNTVAVMFSSEHISLSLHRFAFLIREENSMAQCCCYECFCTEMKVAENCRRIYCNVTLGSSGSSHTGGVLMSHMLDVLVRLTL